MLLKNRGVLILFSRGANKKCLNLDRGSKSVGQPNESNTSTLKRARFLFNLMFYETKCDKLIIGDENE